jgi:hypothetical protein
MATQNFWSDFAFGSYFRKIFGAFFGDGWLCLHSFAVRQVRLAHGGREGAETPASHQLAPQSWGGVN